jgi:hypothetical protein
VRAAWRPLALAAALPLVLAGAAWSSGCDRADVAAAPAVRPRPAELVQVTLKALGVT